jgi:thioredoxin 1
MNLASVNDTDFTAEVLGSDQVVAVDFWAEWCGPCRAFTPVVEAVAADHPELKVVKLNVDESPSTAATYNVMSIPTLILFRDGEELTRLVGSRTQTQLDSDLAQAVA